MFPYPSGQDCTLVIPWGTSLRHCRPLLSETKDSMSSHRWGLTPFGLPAEQYAMEHGIHPALFYRQNIDTFKRQLNKIGFCYDWSREVRPVTPPITGGRNGFFPDLRQLVQPAKRKSRRGISALINIFEKRATRHPFPTPNSTLPNSSAKPGLHPTNEIL